MEEAIFACGGYTRREVVPDLVVISLNTMLWGVNLNKKYNQGNPNNELHVPDHYTEDPFGQLQWLKEELSKARAGGKKVYIVGHHPPADQSVIVLAGEDLWKQGFQLRYEHIVSEFSDVVAAQMFGHVHTNEVSFLGILLYISAVCLLMKKYCLLKHVSFYHVSRMI